MVDRRSVAVPLFVMLVSCGGSASETPPPLEPDPHALPRLRETAAPGGSAAQGESDEPLPMREAPPTWGSGKKRGQIVREPRLGDGG